MLLFNLLEYFIWDTINVQLGAITSNFVFEAVKGGVSDSDNLGDICIDNIHVRSGLCCKLY